MFNLGPMEVLVIILVALVVLGPKRLPEAMRQVGKATGEMRRWSTQLTSQVHSAFDADAPPAPVRATVPVTPAATDTADATPGATL